MNTTPGAILTPTLYIYTALFPSHYTWKVAVKGYTLRVFMMNKLAMLNSGEIILKKYFFLPKIIVK
jgi:hypothetical protein